MEQIALENSYNETLSFNQGRLVNLYNLDPTSLTYGVGDRKYWAWKTIDFPNSTFQSGVTSLAISILNNICWDKEFYLNIIDSIINATELTSNKNYSLNESFPNENSYCVTALVAFDILFTIDLLKDILAPNKKEEYLSRVEPHIEYLKKNDEKHAFISNHLATGAAAMFYWAYLTNRDTFFYKNILDKIYSKQSAEGWYKEYEGPDIGYQTLCTYYLSTIYIKTKEEKLGQSLKKSLKFLYNFLHPNYTIGGLYASRNTEVYYPGGISALSSYFEDAAIICAHLKKGINLNRTVLPQDIDPDNYIPLLNSYAFASLQKESKPIDKKLFYETPNNLIYKECGIELFSNSTYFSIFNYKKGGVIKVFDLKTNKCILESGGVLIKFKNKYLTSQRFNELLHFDTSRRYILPLYYYKESYPSTLHTIIIRVLSLFFFRSIIISELFKKAVVKLLMTNKHKTKFKINMKLVYNPSHISITYKLPKALKNLPLFTEKFKTIHMASSGYTIKNETIKKISLVKFNIR